MSYNLLRKIKYHHLRLIHDYPNGIKNRFENTADKWVKSLNDPHIKTYHELMVNKQTQQHLITFHQTETEETELKKAESAIRPGLAALKQYHVLIFPTRPDDKEPARDIKDMNWRTFIEQGRKQLTDVHRLVLTGFGFIIYGLILYFTFFYDKQFPKNERVKVMNAQIIESYHFLREEADFKRIKQKIKIINDEYQKQLTNSKVLT